jgi:hypothetical protein
VSILSRYASSSSSNGSCVVWLVVSEVVMRGLSFLGHRGTTRWGMLAMICFMQSRWGDTADLMVLFRLDFIVHSIVSPLTERQHHVED